MSFLNSPIFDNTTEKVTLNFKQSTSALLPKVVDAVNAFNQALVERETASRPDLAGAKAAKLDPSAVVEMLIEDAARNNPVIAAFLATGEVKLPTAAAPAKKK